MALYKIQNYCMYVLGARSHIFSNFRYKSDIDYSRYPKVNEDEIEEHFIRGSGPGGSNVNKTANCVLLKHLPTGIVIKCHESRLLQKNQELARELLLNKLDEFYNGEMSVSAQKKRLENMKSASMRKKQEKLRELKKAFKEVSDKNS